MIQKMTQNCTGDIVQYSIVVTNGGKALELSGQMSLLLPINCIKA